MAAPPGESRDPLIRRSDSGKWVPAFAGMRSYGDVMRLGLDVAIEDLDQHVLRAAHEGDAHAGADRLWLDGELGAFRLQFVADPVDIAHAQTEMIEPNKAAFRLLGEIGVFGDLGDEDHDPAEIDVGALDAVRQHRFDNLGGEHSTIIGSGLVRVRTAQVDVIVYEFGHRGLPGL